MDVEQFKEDVHQGRIPVDRLIDLIVTLQKQLDQANRRIEELERKAGGSATAKVDEPYSMRAEEQRQQRRAGAKRKRNRKQRKGRTKTADKVARAARVEKVFPRGVTEESCWLSHTRPVWRLENGQAVFVAYKVYRGPNNQYGQVPGVLGRSEFGIEIVLAIAYQVYVVGLSFGKVCLLLNFFQNLPLRKSQVDALLYQLSRVWEGEFDTLCTLLANSLIVHTDETGWSLHSVWAFLSEKVRLLFFGVPKDAATLKKILDPEVFAGLVVSDDAAVYANFSHSQKCWAHLLRKAIKLTLLEPANVQYRQFTDRLLEIYRAACRVQSDGRLGDAGRTRKVKALEDEIVDLCLPTWAADLPKSEGPADDYRLLVNEIMRLMLDRQLFTFVTTAAATAPSGVTMPAPGTNNEAERTLRNPAGARDTGRTTKTPRGARRRTVNVSVLESLRQHLATFTLSTVIAEVRRWQETGVSCFARLLKKSKLSPKKSGLSPPMPSLLDLLFPAPSG
jgi:transposase